MTIAAIETTAPSKATSPTLFEPPREAEYGRGAVVRRMISYMWLYKGRTVLFVILLAVQSICNALWPRYTGSAYTLLAEGGSWEELVPLLGGMAIAATGAWIAGMIGQYLLAWVAQNGLYRLRRELFEHMQTLSLNFYDRQPIGVLMSGITNDLENVSQFFQSGLPQFVSGTFQLLIISVAMLTLYLPLALVALLIVPVMLILAYILSRISGPGFAKLQDELSELNGFSEESLSGERVIIAYRRQEGAERIMRERSDSAREVGKQAQFVSLFGGSLSYVFNALSILLVIVVGAAMVINRGIPFGVITAMAAYTAYIGTPLGQAAALYNNFLAAVAGAARVFKILDEQPKVKDNPGAAPFTIGGGEVVFEDVDFSYVEGRKILRHNSFVAKPGEMIGLCGPTGAGKSTIINILTRYYDLDSGTITIDGQDIKDVKQADLRLQISAVLQEPFLFSDTVMNNLKYAREGASDEDCIAAAKEANAHEFIMSLPEGYNTFLTRGGANLSQGQRQMLTIARAMVADPKILILDEATSNVDTRTEKLIQEGLQRLMSGRTSFVIAHRLSTIRPANKILVINNGEIIEAGSHDALMAQRGFYYDLFMTQFRGQASAAAPAV
jgi:ATP-binding cassette, subfamily B, bacterial